MSPGPDAWMPHGHCYYWTREVLVPTLIGHGMTALAYAGLPICLLIVVRMMRLEGAARMFAVLFAAFILSCGIGHILEASTIKWPNYRLMAYWHVGTGLISLATLHAAILALVRRKAILAWVAESLATPGDLAAIGALSLVAHKMPGLHVLAFRPDADGVLRYTDGTRRIYEHMGTAPLDVAGRPCEEWLTEIGAGDIYPLYARVVAGETVTFRYDHGGHRSVTTVHPYQGGGLVVSTMLGEGAAAFDRAPTVADLLGAS